MGRIEPGYAQSDRQVSLRFLTGFFRLREMGTMGEFIPQTPSLGTHPQTPFSLRGDGSFMGRIEPGYAQSDRQGTLRFLTGFFRLREMGTMGEFIPQTPSLGTHPQTPSSLRAYGSFFIWEWYERKTEA